MAHDDTPWWHHAVIYQIYPRSFADAAIHPGAEPGVGTVAGITGRLDYLEWLGVDALWLSPVFRSPMADFGYDVSDYCDIDPVFGDLGAVDALIAGAHQRGLRILLDWVPNHTSNQHPWFLESRRDRTNPKADWYVWRDEPATNWNASFLDHRPAWTFDERRGQYYLHCFLPEQPDLNWDHPGVEAAMHATLRFWLDRGIDGFRMDVVHLIGKDYADDPPQAVANGLSHVIFNDVEITHERLRRLRALLDEYPRERMSVGEVYLLDEERMASYYGTAEHPELHLSFNFGFLWTAFDAAALRDRIARTMAILTRLGATPTWVFSNHDVPRHRGRFGGGEREARMAAVLLLTLPGTPFLYQGEELGLVDADIPPDRRVDPGGRDGCRAPIPWDGTDLHGWQADPWLPFPPEATERNVVAQRTDDGSILQWYRRLIHLRQSEPNLLSHEFELVDLGEQVVAYHRGDLVVVLNLGDDPASLGAPHRVVACTHAEVGTDIREVPAHVASILRRA